MKIAIPLKENNQSSALSMTFGRSNYFALVDQKESSVKIVENPFVDENRKVGQRLLEWLTNEYEVNALMALELGLKVQQLASHQQLQLIIISEKNRTLKQLLDLMKLNSHD
jgi:predicted Fe-Mo cluster-binding NifX family protein